jgi:general secretion pathway protein G
MENEGIPTKPQKRSRLLVWLLRLMGVGVFILLVLALAGPRVMTESPEHYWPVEARLQIEEFGSALDLYKLEVGRYPTTEEGLRALLRAPSGATGWNGPYLKRAKIPKDPWGNKYRYTSSGPDGPYELVSFGADNREGGEGRNQDISNKEDEKR